MLSDNHHLPSHDILPSVSRHPPPTTHHPEAFCGFISSAAGLCVSFFEILPIFFLSVFCKKSETQIPRNPKEKKKKKEKKEKMSEMSEMNFKE